jgi:hypothetical protein
MTTQIITRDGDTKVGRNEDQIEMEKLARSIPSGAGTKPVSPQELIALHNQRDNVNAGQISTHASAQDNIQESEELPEVSYGVDKVSSIIEKAKDRLATMDRVEKKDVLAEQQKLRYPKDEDVARKDEETQRNKDKYYDDYKKGKDYLKKLKANLLLKLNKISSLLDRLTITKEPFEEKTASLIKEACEERIKELMTQGLTEEEAKKKAVEEKGEYSYQEMESYSDLQGKLKVIGAKIRRALKQAMSVEEDVRMKKTKYPIETDTGREYDKKDTKDRYLGDKENPLNKELSKMWSMTKKIKTARDESMKVEIPDEKMMGGSDMQKLPLDKKEDRADAPKKELAEDEEKKMIKELQEVIKSLEKADEDFVEEIKKIEKAVEHMEKEVGMKPKKKEEKPKEEEDKKGDIGEIEKTPKKKPDLKDIGEEILEESPFGKKEAKKDDDSKEKDKKEKEKKDKEEKDKKEKEEKEKKKKKEKKAEGDRATYLNDYIQQKITETGSEKSVDEVLSQIDINAPILEQLEKVEEVIIEQVGAPSEDGYREEEGFEGIQGPTEVGVTAIFTRKPTKQASYWEVKDKDDETVLRATCAQIYGKKTFEKWDWISSENYGKELCARIREEGPTFVADILGTKVNMTKHASEIEIEAAKKNKKTPALKKKITEKDYYSKAFGDTGYAKKLTKDYKKKASLNEERYANILEAMKKENIELKEKLSQKDIESEKLAKTLTEKEKEKEKAEKEKEKAQKKAEYEETDKKLRIRANKAIALANSMIDKSFIKAEQKEETIDNLMLMDDISFSMEEKITNEKESLSEAVAKNAKGNKLIRKGGLNTGINVISNNNNMGTLKDKLGQIWKKPKST